MEKAFDPVGLQAIKDDYERAFECLDRGLTEDESGDKAVALELYRQGRQHLLRAIGVPSGGSERVGPAWDSARQMQQKMRETLSNITIRLAALENMPEPEPTAAHGAAETLAQLLYPKLPVKAESEKPAPAKGNIHDNQLPGAAGGLISLPHPPVMQQGVPGELPPAYTPQAADGHLTLSYGTEVGELSLVRDEFHRPAPLLQSPNLGEEGQEILFLPRGVQIFFVTPEGHVSAPSYPGYLRIVSFDRQHLESAPSQPPAYLQVCEWVYPLTPDSPVLLCNTGVFMFPDTMASTPGSYVGVVLSSELPASDHELFQDHLSQLTDLRLQAPEEAASADNLGEKVPLDAPEEAAAVMVAPEEEKPAPEWSEKVAHGILTGASWLSWGLVKGAEYTEKAIHKGASKLREHITPENVPAEVNPNVAKGLNVAKQATGGAVKVSQFLVDGVCTVAGRVGRELAPHVKKHGSKLIPESLKKDKNGRSTLDGAMVVAASGMQGLATMWTGLETASKSIGKSVASETVSTVKHKFRGLENILDPPSNN
ncbi:spartin a isoform X2 [Megalops cyprinoides]|uniref:spartin a isoform X2 n=1 Tax=Megalops cyprinoides TaxID=118141 RepID=UPI00186418FB|nr:spartin a isoform X2 [Megalops cyprinoides]